MGYSTSKPQFFIIFYLRELDGLRLLEQTSDFPSNHEDGTMNGFPPDLQSQHGDWLTSTYKRYERPLVAYARALLRGDWELAKDAVQDTFVQLCKQPWPEIESKAEGWLFLVCRNRCLDLVQRWEARMHTTISTEQWQSQSDPNPLDPARRSERNEEHARLRELVKALSERQQEVLRLRLQQGLSYQQIADATGSSIATVGFHLHEALTLLRLRMRE